MSDQIPLATTQGRFWRRGFALTIDISVISFAVGLVGLILFTPTGGVIRVSNLLLNSQHCRNIDPTTIKVDLLSDFRTTHAVICTQQFLGHVHDRFLTAAEVTRSGNTTYTRQLDYPIDGDGKPMHAFYLDNVEILVILAYLLLAQWRYGTTLGKQMLGLRVRAVRGGLPNFIQVIKRLTLSFLPMFPVVVFAAAALVVTPAQMLGFVPYSFGLVGIGALLFIAIIVNFIVATKRGELPWHDRWARTEVVRTTMAARPGTNDQRIRRKTGAISEGTTT